MEAEKKKNKELASSVVKLNGIIKTGHDALTQEQNLVEQLRKQLASGSQAVSLVSMCILVKTIIMYPGHVSVC